MFPAASPHSATAETVIEITSALNWAFAHVSNNTATVTMMAVLSAVADLRAASALRALRAAEAETVARAGAYEEAGLNKLARMVSVAAGCAVFFVCRSILLKICSLFPREALDVLAALVAVTVACCGFVPWSALHRKLRWPGNSQPVKLLDPTPIRNWCMGLLGRYQWISDLPSTVFFFKTIVVNALLLTTLVIDYSTWIDNSVLHVPF